ncbi:MAG: hypothetical protein ACFFAO_16960, partial [Candidatus Hermodarchaeota archaeon]
MNPSIQFYEVIDLEKKCPRRTILSLTKIQGNPQYFNARKSYERLKIYEHLAKKFSKAKYNKYAKEVEKIFLPRLKKEKISDLTANLDSLIAQYNIQFTEINISTIYNVNKTPIDIYLDGLGTFDGKNAIFKLNLTTRLKHTDALFLVSARHALKTSHPTIEKLVVLKLGSGEIRDLLKEGDRTKSGSLDKRSLPPWK